MGFSHFHLRRIPNDIRIFFKQALEIGLAAHPYPDKEVKRAYEIGRASFNLLVWVPGWSIIPQDRPGFTAKNEGFR